MNDLKFYLNKALEENFALGAFNFSSLETLRAITNATKKTSSPAIIAVSESSFQFLGDYLLPLVTEAKRQNPALFLHLDHGKSFEICKQAIDMGFDSVMIDASYLNLDENISKTKQVCDYAHTKGVLVEAELGQIGANTKPQISNCNLYTNPEEAKVFVEKTGVDMLAISIGTSHGVYKNCDKSTIKFDLLSQIEKMLPNFPLVLHGASSVTNKQLKAFATYGGKLEGAGGIDPKILRKAIKGHNIVKINTNSDLRLEFTTSLRETLQKNPSMIDYKQYLSKATEKLEKLIEEKIIKILNSQNKI